MKNELGHGQGEIKNVTVRTLFIPPPPPPRLFFKLSKFPSHHTLLSALGCVYLGNFWLESGFSNVFQANLEVDKRKAFFKGL